MKAVFPCSLSSQIQCFVLALLRFQRKVFSVSCTGFRKQCPRKVGQQTTAPVILLLPYREKKKKKVANCMPLAQQPICMQKPRVEPFFLPILGVFLFSRGSVLMASKYILLLSAIFSIRNFLPFTYVIRLHPASTPRPFLSAWGIFSFWKIIAISMSASRIKISLFPLLGPVGGLSHYLNDNCSNGVTFWQGSDSCTS